MPTPSTPSDEPPLPIETSVPTEAAEPKGPTDVILKVLGAIGTGIGILGFVTFFGGAILWVRFNEAKLPATEAVAVIPRSVLVTTGATFVAPAVATAAGVVLASLIVYLVANLRPGNLARKQRDAAKKTRQRAEGMGREANAAVLAAKSTRAKLTAREKELADAKAAHEDERAQWLKTVIAKERPEAERLEGEAEWLVSAAVKAKATAYNETEAAEMGLQRSRPQLLIEAGVGAAALLVIPLLSNRTIWHVPLKWWGLILGLVLVLAAAISVFVYLETERFVWFGITAFIAVGIYLGLSTYVSTERNVKMQPAAALRTGHDPVYGAFVADTSSNLYIGTFGRTHKPPHLLVIPRAQVTELTIGPLLDPDKARNRAIAMALEECSQLIEEPATETTPAKKKRACEPDQKKALRDVRG